jgi:hypothetical protein
VANKRGLRLAHCSQAREASGYGVPRRRISSRHPLGAHRRSFAVRAALPYVAIQVPHWEVHVDCGHRHCYVSNAAGGFDIIYHARPVSRIPILDGTNFRTSRAARPPGLWAVK